MLESVLRFSLYFLWGAIWILLVIILFFVMRYLFNDNE